MNLTLARLGRTALDLLYPPRCVLCDRGGDFVCTSCSAALPRADGLRCEVCWLPLQDRACTRCLDAPLALSQLRSAFRYEGDVRRLVHAFKFSGHSCLAEPLASLMLPLLADDALAADVISAVPLTGGRQRQRGFNQALLLAKRLGEVNGLPVVEALSRRRFPGPQAGSATAEQRRRNVEGAFAARRPDAVRDKRVLLVDDVATTGATLDACAHALLEAGAAGVAAITLARED